MANYSVRVKQSFKAGAGILLLVIFLLLFSFSSPAAGAAERAFGDVDGKDGINVNDVVLVMKYVLGLDTLTIDQRELADVSNNGAINVADVVLIMQYILDLVDEFPAELAATETFITVNPIHDAINGHNWSPGVTVTVTVDGEEFTAEPDGDGSFEMARWEYPDLEVEIGQTVVASDGDVTKVHIVRDLKLEKIDPDDDTVSGTAAAGSEVEVRAYDMSVDFFDMPLRVVEAGANGKWLADFSESVGDEPSDDAFDIELGVTGEARIVDLTNDATLIYWHYEDTVIEVYPEGSICGFGWSPTADITITVNTAVYEVTADEHGMFDTEWEGLDIEVGAGDTVEVTDGITTKVHLVTALEITAIDWAAGIISGLADTDLAVKVKLLKPLNGYGPPQLVDEDEVMPEPDGSWTVDFAEEITADIYVFAYQEDDDGDRTVVVAEWVGVGSIEYDSYTEDSITFLVKDAEDNPYDGTVPGAVTLREQDDKGLTDYAVIRADSVDWSPNIDGDGYATITFSNLEHKNVEGYVMPFTEYFQVTVETADGEVALTFVVELECGGGFTDTWQDATIEDITFM